jgi:hypothetical protein
MENAGIFYGRLEYFTVIWCILWPFGNVLVIWYIFTRFGILCQETSGSPASELETLRFAEFRLHGISQNFRSTYVLDS